MVASEGQHVFEPLPVSQIHVNLQSFAGTSRYSLLLVPSLLLHFRNPSVVETDFRADIRSLRHIMESSCDQRWKSSLQQRERDGGLSVQSSTKGVTRVLLKFPHCILHSSGRRGPFKAAPSLRSVIFLLWVRRRTRRYQIFDRR